MNGTLNLNPLGSLARRRHPAGFSPAALPGLALWLRADAGVFADLAKTTPAAGGGAVACWADRSGHGRDATQPTSGDRPTLAAAVLNGLPGVAFDGLGSNLVTTFGATLAQPNTAFIVFDITRTSSPQIVFEGTSQAASNGLYHDQGVYAIFGGAEVGGGGGGAFLPLPAPFVALAIGYDGAASYVRRDGAPYSAGDAGSVGVDSLTLGVRTGGAFPYGGRLAELILYNARLTGPQVAQVEAYLNARYNLF